MPFERLEASVIGVVQGVGFRYFVETRAEMLGIRGWAANMADGSVKVVAEGDVQAIHAFLNDLREGPRHARVDDVKYSIRTIDRVEFISFDIRYDGY